MQHNTFPGCTEDLINVFNIPRDIKAVHNMYLTISLNYLIIIVIKSIPANGLCSSLPRYKLHELFPSINVKYHQLMLELQINQQ